MRATSRRLSVKSMKRQPVFRLRNHGPPSMVHQLREARHVQKQQALGELKAALRAAEQAVPKQSRFQRLIRWVKARIKQGKGSK